MTRQELETKLQEINLRKNDCLKKQDYEEAARLRDIEKCIFKILKDPLLNEAEVKVNAINRERQMLSVLEDVSFLPYKMEETEEYKKLLENYAIGIAKEELR
jgi:hypothetical protein